MSNNEINMVEVSKLQMGYGNNILMRNLNFSIKQGEIFIILGGSGCGKTTLLKHIIGLMYPQKGDIKIMGESIVKAQGKERRKLMRSFGVLYQSGALFSSYSIKENLALPLKEYTKLPEEMIKIMIQEKLDLVGLSDAGNLMPSELSGGMRKRVGLARAMILNPQILFFDEPSAGLDPVSAAQLDNLILNIRKELNTTMVIVSHELDSIFAIADRIAMLDKEKQTISALGTLEDIKKNSNDPWIRKFLSRDGLKY